VGYFIDIGGRNPPTTLEANMITEDREAAAKNLRHALTANVDDYCAGRVTLETFNRVQVATWDAIRAADMAEDVMALIDRAAR